MSTELNSAEYQFIDDNLKIIRARIEELKQAYLDVISLVASKTDDLKLNQWITFFESEILRLEKVIDQFETAFTPLIGTANEITVSNGQIGFSETPVFSNDVVGLDFISAQGGSIGRDGQNRISYIVKESGRVVSFGRDVNGAIVSATDGTRTWNYIRNGNNQITSWTIS